MSALYARVQSCVIFDKMPIKTAKRMWLGLSLLCVSARAEEALSWRSCIELAIKNNTDLKAAEANFQSAQYLEGSARSGFFPQLSANLGVAHGNSSSGSLNTSTEANTS